MEAALEVFSQKGFRGSSINEISAKAGMSTPSMLYYFASKEELHRNLLERTMLLWLGPLNMLQDSENPVDELCVYVQRKLEISERFPRESRLFANEILMGVPRAKSHVFDPIKSVFDSKAILIEKWINEKKIAVIDPHHLLYSIWATTQHYADYETQIAELSPGTRKETFRGAEDFLITMYRKLLEV